MHMHSHAMLSPLIKLVSTYYSSFTKSDRHLSTFGVFRRSCDNGSVFLRLPSFLPSSSPICHVKRQSEKERTSSSVCPIISCRTTATTRRRRRWRRPTRMDSGRSLARPVGRHCHRQQRFSVIIFNGPKHCQFFLLVRGVDGQADKKVS